MPQSYLGPTAYEMAMSRIQDIQTHIQLLLMEKRSCEQRAKKYASSRMLESERIATQAEKFQEKMYDGTIDHQELNCDSQTFRRGNR